MAKRGRPPHPDVLTPREWEVLSLIRDGLTNDQIAERIGVTIHAARYHVSQILSKLGVATREEAATWQGEPMQAGGRAIRMLQVGLGLAALVALLAVGIIAWGVLRSSGGDTSAASVSPSATSSPTPTPPITPSPGPTKSRPAGYVERPRPDVGANVESAQLTTGNAGTVLTEDGVYRVTFSGDGAGPASNITPKGVAPRDIRGVHFLDAEHGWLVASGTITNPDANDGTSSLQLLVFRTTDGGESWQSSPLANAFIYFEARYDRASIDFLNTEHGWVVIDTQVTMNSATGHLFRTDDGGQTWTQLTAVAGDPIYFVDDNNGWQAVSPCSTCPVSKLYVTHNGGQTWTDASDITPLSEPSGPRAFGLPTNLEDGEILLPVTVSNTSVPSVFVLYSSPDNGQTWRPSAITPIATSEFSPFPSTYIFTSGEVVVFAGDGSVYHLTPGDTDFTSFTATKPSSSVNYSSPGQLSFSDPQRGWAIAGDAGCVTYEIDCWLATFVEQTLDGGQTWSPLYFGTAPTPTP